MSAKIIYPLRWANELRLTLVHFAARVRRAPYALTGLCLLLMLVVLASVGVGAVRITPTQVIAILGKQLGLSLPWTFEAQQEAVLMAIRLPRVLLGVLIGAALAVAGAAMQGLFRNPLADPGLIGVGSGASLAAVGMIVLGVTQFNAAFQAFGLFTLPLAAFMGSAIATLIVYRLSSASGRTVVSTMLLAGIALNALMGAGIGLLTYMATDAQLRNITFWSLGSLGSATWRTVMAAAPFILIAVVTLPQLARALNALALGEAEAGHLGVSVEWTKRSIIALVALAVGTAVALAGMIGFIGLVVPHLLRLLVGPDHRTVLPGATLLGASLLLSADLIARTLVAPAELPIGIVTAALGAPFFLWLLLRDRRKSEL
jgi:iron complex transport system permease protein